MRIFFWQLGPHCATFGDPVAARIFFYSNSAVECTRQVGSSQYVILFSLQKYVSFFQKQYMGDQRKDLVNMVGDIDQPGAGFGEFF